MAWSSNTVNASSWSLIGNNVAIFSFQVIGQNSAYINVTTANTAPSETLGIIYENGFGELRIDPATISSTGVGTYVWARSITSTTKIVYA